LMMMMAFLMAGWAIQLDLRARGLDEDFAADIIIAGVIGGLVGAKLWYVFLYHDSAMLFRRGGFVWYGGFLGAAAGILLDGWRRRDHGHAIGWLFAWYLVFAATERFLVELVRAKDDRLLGPFTLAQGMSVVLILLGAALLYKWRVPAGPQPLPESLRPKEVAL